MRDGKTVVMIAGLSSQPDKGKMARLVAEAVVKQPDMFLHNYALAEEHHSDLDISGNSLALVSFDGHKSILEHAKEHGVDLVVDFTLPKSVVANAGLYCMVGMPFVMGTTGGDREALIKTVKESNTYAVIATNFSIPVVVFQQMIKFAAENFPGALEGFDFMIDESHQVAKVDKSGSAIGLLAHFSKLLKRQVFQEAIRSERSPVAQALKLGIPKEYLGGHGYHDYRVQSPDGSVDLHFEHNVRGRQTYVDGVLKAIRWVAAHPNNQGRAFDMLDVLKG